MQFIEALARKTKMLGNTIYFRIRFEKKNYIP